MNVTQLRTLDRSRVTDVLGTLSEARMREVLEGLTLVFGINRFE